MGHYDVSYEKITSKWARQSSDEDATEGLYQTTSDLTNRYFGASVYTGGQTESAGSASASGTFKVKFHWNNEGDELAVPPQIAIVREDSFASWQGDSGSCADGLNGNPYNSGGGQACESIKYFVQENPGSDFEYIRGPSAASAVVKGSTWNLVVGSGTATVRYCAAAVGVGVTFPGIVIAGTSRIASMGSKVTAFLANGLALVLPSDLTCTWTLNEDGCPFSRYVPTDTQAEVTPFSPDNSRQATSYFAAPASNTFTCKVDIPSWNVSFTVSNTMKSVQPAFTSNVTWIKRFKLKPNVNNPNEMIFRDDEGHAGFKMTATVADNSSLNAALRPGNGISPN